MDEDISNALSGKSRALFILKLLTMLFTTLDIVRREDDMPESDSRVATRIDPGSGQKVRTSKYFLLQFNYFLSLLNIFIVRLSSQSW